MVTDSGELRPIEVNQPFDPGDRVTWSDQYRKRTGTVKETDDFSRNGGYLWVKGDDSKLRRIRPGRLTKLSAVPVGTGITPLPLNIGVDETGQVVVTCQLHNPCQSYPMGSESAAENFYSLLDAVRHCREAGS